MRGQVPLVQIKKASYTCYMTYMINLRTFVLILIGSVSLSLSGCAVKNKNDPLEGYNRGMYKINKTLDTLFLLPVTRSYVAVIPKPVRNIVSNFYQNLRTIPTVLNDILQADAKATCSDAARLVLNTTLGIGGLFDVASKAGLERRYSDFGMTLARWGHRDSTYIVLPLFGPSTIRDGIGIGVTYYMSVWAYIPKIRVHHHKAIALRNWLFMGDLIDTRAELLDLEKVVETAAVDEYVFIRDAYMQHRKYEIEGKSQNQSSPGGELDMLQGPPE